MNRYGYDGNEQFRPLTPWAYFWYTVLFCVPIVGFIFLIVFSVSDKNINRRSFARSFWCGLLISAIPGLVRGLAALARKLCYKEVAA